MNAIDEGKSIDSLIDASIDKSIDESIEKATIPTKPIKKSYHGLFYWDLKAVANQA